MKSNYFVVIPLLLISFLIGCTTVSVNKNLTINGLYFENDSKHKLDEVRISVDKTGAFASCAPVLAGSTCSTNFEPLIYQGNPVHILWVYKGVTHQEGPFTIEPPKETIKDLSAKVIIHFDRLNQLTIKIIY